MILLFLISFIAVAVLMPLARKIAKRAGLVDAPGGRKDHVGEVPLVGGLVIVPVFMALSLLMGAEFSSVWPLYAGLVLLLIMGALDDRFHMRAGIKFGVQGLAALLAVLPGGAVIHQLGNLFGLGDFGLGFMAIPFSLACVMLVINAINLMDGLDGLAGGASFVILACFALAGWSVHTPQILILLGALAGFLIYNMRSPFRRKAAVFLGDAGSLCLGLMIAWFAIKLSGPEIRVIEPMGVAWVLALPIWDECAQFYRRVREGRHPFSPDRGHFHHHFIQAGFTPGQSVSIILGIMALTGFLGIAGISMGMPLPMLTVVWIIGILTHMAVSKELERYPALIIKLFPRLKV
ncbi:MAG: undecaprenyl/decaprenyl-phosphate alpha-N-acetylglucosaminyl 1-phosphate transferase [Rhodospirillales bacterium]|nr:undecaprenyl/decaprenyl-phosphate alpha-N-acetylglucosaminyl 1-phosphate transferase [Rhodospirillales bacterium]